MLNCELYHSSLITSLNSICSLKIVDVANDCRNKLSVKYPNAKCIVYDDEDCNDDDFGFGLSAGEEKSLGSNSVYRNNIETVSVQAGCTLQIWTGK